MTDPRTRYPRALYVFPPRDVRDILQELVEEAAPGEIADVYGRGPLIESFEAELAALLGKPAAVFLPSGTMAQPIALRLWSQRRGSPSVAMHPTSHLLLHEHGAYQHLHDLRALPVGPARELMTPADIERLADPCAALLVELPQRELGGLLPTWDDLQALLAAARARGMALHLDGARLWECGPHYGRSYAEIVAGFDSVYVSFYKGLRGIAGAILAGPADFVEAARIWKRRQGGDLIALYPYLLAARRGLREHLPRMPDYVAHAQAIAAALADIPGLRIRPSPPVTPMMHLFLAGDPDVLAARALAVSDRTGIWLFHRRQLQTTDVPGWWRLEIAIGAPGCALEPAEVAAAFTEICADA